MIEVTLPFPPSVNNLFAGRHRRYPSKRYVAWRRESELEIVRQCRGAKSLPGPVVIDIELAPPDRRPRDADNYLKGIVDLAVRMRLIADDNRRHVAEVRARWIDGPARAVVRLLPVS